MLIGLLRAGKTDVSLNQVPIRAITGEELCTMSIAEPGMFRWDLKKKTRKLRTTSVASTLEIFKEAGRLLAETDLPCGDTMLGPGEFASLFSQATGTPVSVPLSVLERIRDCFTNLGEILAFQAIDGKIEAYDRGFVERNHKLLAWIPTGKNLLVVTPSNHPAVNILWAIACAMGYPITIRPSLDDPFTPLRIISALIHAGIPAENFSFYPTHHEAVDDLVALHDRCMIFGGPQLVKKYGNLRSCKVYGPGRSVMIVADDFCDDFDTVVDLAVVSMMKDGGRGCINLSTIICEKNGAEIARRIAEKIVPLKLYCPLDSRAQLGAFKYREAALAINAQIDTLLGNDRECTAEIRKSPRLVEEKGATFLLPTVVYCTGKSKQSTLFGKEYPFPFITVIEQHEEDQIVAAAAGGLAVTLLSNNPTLYNKILFSPDIAKLYHGYFATTDIDFQDPHEGLISDFLFTTKALRTKERHGSLGR